MFHYYSLYCTSLVCLFYSVFYLYGAAACQLFIKRICYVVMLCSFDIAVVVQANLAIPPWQRLFYGGGDRAAVPL